MPATEVVALVVVGGLMSSSLPKSTTMIVLVGVPATEEGEGETAGVDPTVGLLLSARAASVGADTDSFAFSTAGGFAGGSEPLLDATAKGAATQGSRSAVITSGSVTVAESAFSFPSSSPEIALICTSVLHLGVSCVPVLELTGSVLERTESSGNVVSAVCVAVTNIVAAVAAPTADVEDTAAEYSAHTLPSGFSEESADSVFCNKKSDIQILIIYVSMVTLTKFQKVLRGTRKSYLHKIVDFVKFSEALDPSFIMAKKMGRYRTVPYTINTVPYTGTIYVLYRTYRTGI